MSTARGTPAKREPLFHVQDVVALATARDQLGVVVRTHLDPEEYEDSPDFDPSTNLAPHEVEVTWSATGGTPHPRPPAVYAESDLVLVDRSFVQGDVVSDARDHAKVGTVVAVHEDVDLRDMRNTSTVVRGVDFAQLRSAYPFLLTGTPVFMDKYVGWIHDARTFKVRAVFSNGAIGEIDAIVFERIASLQGVDPARNADPLPPTEPGLVFTWPPQFSQAWDWHATPHLRSVGNGYGVVTELLPTSVTVQWVESSLPDDADVEWPPAETRFADLKLMEATTPFHLGALVRRIADDQPDGTNAGLYRVERTRTTLTVRWHDATVSHDVPVTAVRIPLVVDDTLVWPGDIVWNRMGDVVTLDDADDLRVGVAQSADNANKIAIVRWFDPAWETLGEPETVSLYEVSAHPQFVVDLAAKVFIPGNRNLPDFAWFGEVVAINKDGTRDFRLGNGTTQTIRFDRVVPIALGDDDHPDDDGSDAGSVSDDEWVDEDGEDGEWESADENAGSSDDDEAGEGRQDAAIIARLRRDLAATLAADPDGINMLADAVAEAAAASMTPGARSALAALVSANPAAAAEVAPLRAAAAPAPTEPAETTAQSEPEAMDVDASGAAASDVAPAAAADAAPVANGTEPAAAAASPPEDEEIEGLEKFEVLDDSDDVTFHYPTPTPMTSSLMRQIRKEHQLLQGNLPDGIVVRAFADRMDVLVVLIFGPHDTPYARCPFLFEIQLPADYPNSPPLVYFFNRGGGRINPNLHEDGKVCLSLLGTWQGAGPEAWNPAKSTILQFLVSVQGLILIKEPYFLEPGFMRFTKTDDGEANSKAYNEKVTILALKTAISTLTRPPAYFRDALTAYYSRHRNAVLDHARAVLEQDGLTEGAKIMLRPVIDNLERALDKALAAPPAAAGSDA
ncbi:hypothetical protein H9P43_008790 [Blastocladiella emersonii ATCC 22665]|nr:hypothetical protein H9P43_008790 [Blastocladiella emersonii ATCC 22665]